MDERDNTTWLTSPAVVPVLVALGGIALYVVGLLNMIGGLRDADLSTEDVLPLLPVERHLTAGIGALANPLTLFVVLGGALTTWYLARQDGPGPPVEEGDGNDPVEAPEHRPVGRTDRAIIVLVLASLALISPVRAAILIPAVALGGLAVYAIVVRGGSVVTMTLTYLLVSFSVQGILESFVRPDPVPSAELRLTDNSERIGDWIGVNQGTVYIAQGGRVLGIPNSKVMWARIKHRDREPDESLVELIGLR